MMDVALFGRTPRFDEGEDDETTVDCFRRFGESESNRLDEGLVVWVEPLARICDSGV